MTDEDDDPDREHEATPKPENFAELMAAWDNPDAWRREIAKYNAQLTDAGFTTVTGGYTDSNWVQWKSTEAPKLRYGDSYSSWLASKPQRDKERAERRARMKEPDPGTNFSVPSDPRKVTPDEPEDFSDIPF